jgi:hypothetical protein
MQKVRKICFLFKDGKFLKEGSEEHLFKEIIR